MKDIGDGRDYSTDPARLALRSPSYLGMFVDVPGGATAKQVENDVREALKETLTEDLTNDAIAGAKAELVRFLGAWLLSPDLLPLADHLAAFTFIDGTARRLNRLPDEIRAISPDRVRALARRYLKPGGFRLALVVP